MSKTWILDGGVKRFAVVMAIAILVISVIISAVIHHKWTNLTEKVAASQTASATVEQAGTGTDHDEDADRPDPLGAARDGLSRWLSGDTGSLTPDAAANAPTAPVGASLADGGDVLVDSPGYAAVNVPMIVDTSPVQATVELFWDNGAWVITNFVVS